MNPSTAPAVRLTGLRKTFTDKGGQEVRAVDGLDLTIDRGEIVAFLGPNGAGKTTTIDMVLGLTEPTSGTARVFDAVPRASIVAGRVSAVLQTGGLLRDLTVRETATVIASTFTAHTPVDEVLARTDLTHLAGRKVMKCSGGEQQRLRFALALLPDPDLLVLDEPTAGMDVSARRTFWATMQQEAREGRTIVFATHYLQEAEDFAQRTVLMAHGRLVADGRTEEVRDRAAARTISARLPAHQAAGIADVLNGIADLTTDWDASTERLSIKSTNSDEIARRLLTSTSASDLQITRASLDEAFIELTTEGAR